MKKPNNSEVKFTFLLICLVPKREFKKCFNQCSFEFNFLKRTECTRKFTILNNQRSIFYACMRLFSNVLNKREKYSLSHCQVSYYEIQLMLGWIGWYMVSISSTTIILGTVVIYGVRVNRSPRRICFRGEQISFLNMLQGWTDLLHKYVSGVNRSPS